MSTDNSASANVHLVCQAHIDPVWIWDWPEGLTETLATFETACDLLDEYPEFVFNHNESVLYEWTRDNRPELFDRIKLYVQQGRWVISGGWFLQPDANLISGESLARHILLGRQFFDMEFGVRPSVAYNLDTFGHNGNLPQFLRLSGYRMYTHFRPRADEKDLPDFLYRWRGVDGSEVIGFRPPCGWYCTHPGSAVAPKIGEMNTLSQEVHRPTTVFWGAGNHGGGATRADLDLIREICAESPGVVHSSFERYCDEVAAPAQSELPVVAGELQKCFTGCYTSIIDNKSRNRRGEGLALAAERFAAMAWWLLGEPYPGRRLQRIWKDVMFNQFHDILPGSSIREGAVSAAQMMGRAATDAKEILVTAHLQLMRRDRKMDPLTVRMLNPHPVRRTIPALIDIQLSTHPDIVKGRYIAVYDSDGNEVCRQIADYLRNTAEWRRTILFHAELPALGIAEYQVRLEETGQDGTARPAQAGSVDDPDAFIHAEGRTLDDWTCRVGEHTRWHEVDEHAITVRATGYTAVISRDSGTLISLTAGSHEYVAGSSGTLVVREDSNDAWGGQQSAYGAVIGRFVPPDSAELSEVTGLYGERPPAPPVRVVASGPLCIVVETILVHKRSVARVRHTFHRYHPHIDFDVLLNFGERRRAVQLELSTTLTDDSYEAEIPHATVTRTRNGGEEPVGRWVMVGGNGNAMCLVNDGPGGVEITDDWIRQTLVRSPVYCSGQDSVDPHYLGEHMDLGEHRYRFRLLFGARDDVVAQRQLGADDLSLPFSYHCSVPLGPSRAPGLAAGAQPFVLTHTDGYGVHLEAMKASEDGTALVVRLAERAGSPAVVRVEAAGVEPLSLAFRPFEMKTLRCDLDVRTESKRSWAECDLLERSGG